MSGDRNRTPGPGHQPAATTNNRSSVRRVLGDVSPNIMAAPPSSLFGNKPIAGSPLKRSLCAAVEGGQGLRYLKKRRLSNDKPLSSMIPPSETRATEVPAGVRPHRRSDLQMPSPKHIAPPVLNSQVQSVNSNNTPESGEEKKSFSSLINYEPSSQTAPNSQQQPTSSLVIEGPSRAELLNLRLRVAMYKVRTNQTNVPFSELQVNESFRPKPPSPSPSLESVDGRVDAQRKEAQSSTKPILGFPPELLPASIVRPTPYGSRLIYNHQVSSSPPAVSTQKLQDACKASTPYTSRLAAHEEQELTSSTVKGRVAEGLLGLKDAA